LPDTTDPTLPQIQFMLACDNVTLDMNQNATFSSVIDTLNASQFPVLTPQFHVVFGMQNLLPRVYTVLLKIEHEDGTQLLEQKLPDVAIPSHQRKARIITAVRGLAWPKPGRYYFKLFMSGALIGAFDVDLALNPGSFAPYNPGGQNL